MINTVQINTKIKENGEKAELLLKNRKSAEEKKCIGSKAFRA